MRIVKSGTGDRRAGFWGRHLRALLLAVSLSAAPVLAQEAPRKPVPEDFIGGPELQGVSLSPNGRFVLSTRIKDRQHILTVTDLEAGIAKAETFPLGVAAIDWAFWVDDNRILLRTEMNLPYVQLDAKAYKAVSNGRSTYVPTLMTFQVDTQELKQLTPGGFVRFALTNQGQITDFLPDDPDHVLLMANLDKGNDLFRLNIRDGSIRRVAQGLDETYAFATDRNGKPVFRFNTNSRGSIIEIQTREDLPDGKVAWRKVRTVRLNREGSNLTAPEFEILYPGPTASSYYVAARPEGAETTGIYLYDIHSDRFLERVSGEKPFDVQNALFDTVERTLLGMYHHEDRLVVEMSSPEMQAAVDAVKAKLAATVDVLPIDRSKSGDRWLFFASGPSDYGSYHVFDAATGDLQLFGHSSARLAGVEAPAVEVVSFAARDGLPLKGYLSRPASAKPGDKLPLIMMPHGGPEARDAYGFDQNVQMLVALGYQVFQPNFRGSSGFGKGFADRGRRQWGKAMQTDIDDAYAHLVAAGLAEEGRACIFGYSYGGYAALAAATLTPDLYQCIIAGAGPSDLIRMLEWERREEGRESEAYLYWVDHIGHPSDDREALAAVSPARLADRVTRPVLLIHGEEDGIVPVEQSEYMEKALKKAGKSVQFLRLEDSAHSSRTEADSRAEFDAIIKFLKRHLPVE